MTWGDGRALPGNRWDLLDGVWPAEPPSVSVVVAHYRQPEQLTRTLAALAAQDHPADRLEIIVADDGSPEVPAVPPGVSVVTQPDDGFRLARVRNLGASTATGDVLVFLDADTTPEPSFIRQLTRLPALAPDAVTVGRRRHASLGGAPADGDVARAARGAELPEPEWLADGYRASRNLLDADDRSYRYIIGAVLACSRAFFDVVGGFEESFRSYGGEDWEWAYRAWIAGAVFAHVPSAVAWHDGPDASGRADHERQAKNAEALLLSDLIPVPGSRGRGLRPLKVDIGVSGPPPPATSAQAFVSVDSALAALPGADGIDRTPAAGRDRVRVHVEILRPVRVPEEALAAAVAQLDADALGEVVLTDASDRDLVRVVSARARARQRRWRRSDLFRTVRVPVEGTRTIEPDVSVEAYVAGWD